jgi:hypothetical protein
MAIVLSDIGALLSNSAPEVLRNMYRWSDDFMSVATDIN